MKRSHTAFAITAAAAGAALILSSVRDGVSRPTIEIAERASSAETAQEKATPAVMAAVRAVPDVGRPLAPTLPRQLTPSGCCAGAWWADDSSGLLFLGKGGAGSTSAIMLAPLWPPGSPVEPAGMALTAHAAGRYVVRQVGGQSEVEDLESGTRWMLPTEGGQVLISPDGARVVWWSGMADEDHYRSLVTVYSSDIDGRDSRELISMWRAVVVGFHPDGRRVLVTGRPERDRAEYALVLLDTETGDMTHLASGSWLSDASLSPSGDWVVYMTSLDRDDPDANGVWVVPTSGEPARKLDFVGAYRWRNGSRLVLVPQEPGAEYHSVWQLDVDSYELVRLVDPADVPIRIANNDWSISPDGHTMSFVSEDDRSIWIIDLP